LGNFAILAYSSSLLNYCKSNCNLLIVLFTVQEESNIVKRFIDNFINNNTGEEGEVDTEVRDSLLSGRTGKFAQVQSSWEVLPDGTRRFLSAIIYGK